MENLNTVLLNQGTKPGTLSRLRLATTRPRQFKQKGLRLHNTVVYFCHECQRELKTHSHKYPDAEQIFCSPYKYLSLVWIEPTLSQRLSSTKSRISLAPILYWSLTKKIAKVPKHTHARRVFGTFDDNIILLVVELLIILSFAEMVVFKFESFVELRVLRTLVTQSQEMRRFV